MHTRSTWPRAILRWLAGVACAWIACAQAAAGAPAEHEVSSLELARQMSPGINLGNTLEAIPAETSWGNPPPSRALLQAYRDAGFRSVRIPVSWSQYVDAEDRIQPAWMAHVRQVADDARAAGLIVVFNIHWDGGWMNHLHRDRKVALNARLSRLWTQIAQAFQDCDDGVLFAGTNEVMEENVWSTPTAENLEVQASLNQTFVDAVRATGGRNARRILVVQAFNTNVDYALKWAELPKDSAASRLMLEVHYYDPFDFTINEKSKVWQWGAAARDPEAVQHWADEAHADALSRSLQARFVEHGVPVIVGEYGAYEKPAYPGMRPYVHDWIRAVSQAMRRHELVPMWWDTGLLFDRRTGVQKDPQTIRLIVESAR
jgi:endoglucanase